MGRQAFFVLLLAGAPVLAAQWIRQSSPHFDLLTDTGERNAARVLQRVENARKVLSPATQWRESDGVKSRILLFGSSKDFAAIRPGPAVTGFFQSGPGQDYIAVLAVPELDRIVLHEYTHLVLNHASAPLPQWLEEGLCELYSTLNISGNRTTVGAAIAMHVDRLGREKWLSGTALAGVGKESLEYNEASRAGIFYAESWALTHMLTFADGYRGKLLAFLEAISGGAAYDDAFESAFGKNIDAAVRDLEAYVRKGFREIEVDTGIAEDVALSKAEPAEGPDVLQSRAEVLSLMGRDEEARRVYQDVARRYPRSPVAFTGLAVLSMRDRNPAEARKHFEHALELGAKDADTLFEYAMLLRDSGEEPAKVTEWLERAVAANPSHAEAQFLLGIRASDADRFKEAASHLEAATRILPRQAYFWQALSFVYYKLGRAPDARLAALRALRAARTEHESEMASGALRLAEEAPKRAAAKPARGVITPDSWQNRKGEGKAAGMLVRVDCEGKGARLHLNTPDGPLVFNVSDPRSVVIKGGAAQRTLSCGMQSPTAVEIEYDDATRQATAIQFQ